MYKKLTICALFSAILCICAPISISIGIIPISLATFAIMLTAIILPLREAITALLVYLILGICGLPVFSSGMSGIHVFIGPTGGYIWSYIFMISVIAGCKKLPLSSRTVRGIIGCFLAIIICHICGVTQYMLLSGVKLKEAVSICSLPFILPDICKAVCAVLLGNRIHSALNIS